ncbi:MAG: hypothetical protein J3K34DRAFT_523439 [Monoraphidium minutum]|nr:MAG: hypothetical protein J3K34DRAFT_523439 [Monoraphidium minutum]
MKALRLSDGSTSAMLFFVIAVAYKAPWTAISSLLGQLSQDHGPRLLLHLNLCYFLPPMPLLYLLSVLQARRGCGAAAAMGGAGCGLAALPGMRGRTPAPLDCALGPRRSAALRFAAGFIALAALSLAFPPALAAGRAAPLLGLTAGVGAAYAVAFGASYQLAPAFGPGCTVALTTGFVSAGALVLLLDVVIKRGAPRYSAPQLDALFRCVAAACAAGLAAAAALLRRSDVKGGGGALSPRASDGGLASGDLAAAGAAAQQRGHYGGADGMRHRPEHGWEQQQPQQQQQQQQHDAPGAWLRAARAAAPAAAAICAGVGTSMAAFPFFAFIPADGALGHHAAAAAFYARLAGDVAGRLLPPRLRARTLARLGAAAVAKAALTPLLLAALPAPRRVGGDYAVVALVAASWVLGGYVNTGAYLVAPALAPQHRGRVGQIMALAFQVSCFLGLLAATALQWLMEGPRGGGAPGSGHAPLAAARS